MRQVVLPALALFGAAASGHAAAAQVPPDTERAMEVARAEFVTRVEKEFTDTDLDKNGTLSAEEIASFRRTRRAERAQQANATRFSQLDQDKNGALDRREFAALTPQAPEFSAVPLVSRFDVDKDGILSLDEYRAGSLVDFERWDTDKDGKLNPAEVKASRAKRASD